MGQACTSLPKSGLPMDGTTIIYSKALDTKHAPGETSVYRTVSTPELIERPSESIKTCYDIFQNGLNYGPDRNCFGTIVNNEIQWVSYSEVYTRAKNIGYGLMHLELCPTIIHDEPYNKNWRFISVFSKNRLEWSLVEQACNCFSITLVPIYDTLGHDTVEFICGQTKLTTIVCSSGTLKATITSILSDLCSNVKTIILMDIPTEVEMKMVKTTGRKLYTLSEIEEIGSKNPRDLILPSFDNVNTFCYTSGTTGQPKGAMITHKNLVAVCAAVENSPIVSFDGTDDYLSYLPLAHILERLVHQVMLYYGCRICFFRGDVQKLVDDLQIVKPTLFVSVPRLYNRIYDKIMVGVKTAGGIKETLFNYALNTKIHNLRTFGTLTHSLWDPIVFSKPKAVLGGRVRLMLSGSAPISGNIHEALKVIFATPMIEGYGMTESSGASIVCAGNETECGHVGGPLSGCDIKLVSVPENNYNVTDEPFPRGEICIKGPCVFVGYFLSPEKTAEAIDSEGWLHSGDIGILRSNGSIKIVDRMKNIFKLAQGEYVAVEKIEMIYSQAPLIAQIFVFGYSTQNFLVGIIVPEENNARHWAMENGMSKESTISEIISNKNFKSAINDAMKIEETKSKLLGFEKVKVFHLSCELFSVENNLLTPTFKLKRNEAKNVYQKEIDDMYASNQSSS